MSESASTPSRTPRWSTAGWTTQARLDTTTDDLVNERTELDCDEDRVRDVFRWSRETARKRRTTSWLHRSLRTRAVCRAI